MSDPPEDDEVGYGRTPKRTRFRKGESGNRNRRYPKRREGRLKMMMRLLLQPVEITQNGSPCWRRCFCSWSFLRLQPRQAFGRNMRNGPDRTHSFNREPCSSIATTPGP
jgi:hypothetical protein